MHRWSRTQKRLMLAAMLLTWSLLPVGCVALGVVFANDGGPDWVVLSGMACFAGAVLISAVTGLACLADARRDRRVTERSARLGWTVALLLASTVAGPVYWWLHVRMEDGEPHGLQTLRPASAWSPLAKALVVVGAVFTLAFLVFWLVFVTSIVLETDDRALIVAAFAAFGVWSVVAPWVVTLLFLAWLRHVRFPVDRAR